MVHQQTLTVIQESGGDGCEDGWEEGGSGRYWGCRTDGTCSCLDVRTGVRGEEFGMPHHDMPNSLKHASFIPSDPIFTSSHTVWHGWLSLSL